MELLLGCGNDRRKRVVVPEIPLAWRKLVTLDMYPECHPDIVHDLTVLPLPFPDATFDEVHAYEVLEHTGQQGDWRFFFAQFAEFWRILKPGGYFCATVPHWRSEWAWGDPGHTRVITRGTLLFLSQRQYEAEVGRTTMADYRHCWRGDFETVRAVESAETTFAFVLRAVPTQTV